MTKYVVEKVLQVVIDDDDLADGESLSAGLAVDIARELDDGEWQQVDIAVVDAQ